MATLELYYSFRSPYSYLAIDRLNTLCKECDVDIDFRIVRPLALREADFFKNGRPQFVPYLLQDVRRESQRLGIAFGLPKPDPIVMDLANGFVPKEQPYFDLLLSTGGAAALRGEGVRFASAIGAAIWGGREDWHLDDNMRDILGDAGLNFDILKSDGASRAADIAAMVEKNEAAQLVHHWGVPLMVYDNEPFFGQDRVGALRWRFDQLGLCQ